MSEFIAIDITGDKELAKKLALLPNAVADAGVVEANQYIVNIMRIYQPYQHISRAEGFPHLSFTTPRGKTVVGYKSYKQFRYVMALVNKGGVPYKRTQRLSRGWKTVGTGRNQIVANETPYAAFVMGAGEQDGLHRRMGWKTMEDRVEDSMGRIVEKFAAGVRKAIRKLGLA